MLTWFLNCLRNCAGANDRSGFWQDVAVPAGTGWAETTAGAVRLVWCRLIVALAFSALLLACDPDRAATQADAGVLNPSSTANVVMGSCPSFGEMRCNPDRPAVLEVCDPNTELGWTEVDTCASAELCDAERGRCLVCTPDEYTCEAFNLKRCNSIGTELQLDNICPSAEYCSSTEQRCLDCLPGTGECVDETLFACNENGDYETITCETRDQCNVASMTCRDCIPDEYQCEQTELVRCSAEKKWEPVEMCATDALCLATASRIMADPGGPTTCEAPVCDVGFRCNPDQPNVLEACPPSRDMWEQIDVCDSAPLCNAEGQICESGCGRPGIYRCNGMALQVCDADGIQWDTELTCNTAEECHVGQKDCVRCTPGEWQCNADALQQCDAQQLWQTRETCASGALCQVVADASEQTCLQGCPQAGQFSCNGAQLVECSSDLVSWDLREVCASPGLCNAVDKRCNPAACPVPGEKICVGGELRQCREDQTAYDLVTTCGEGQICDSVGGGCLSTCPPDPYRCNGPQPEKCEQTAQFFGWQVIGQICASHDLCHASVDGAVCDEPSCGETLADFRCSGNDVQRCNSQRTDFDTVLTCDYGTRCDPGVAFEGPPQCDVCEANSYSCANGSLQRCSADGQMKLSVEQCRDTDFCVTESSGSVGYCYACNVGETRCNSGNLERCADDRRSWVADTTCAPENGCHDNPGFADYCNQCPAPSLVSCETGASLHTCAPDQTGWIGQLSCTYGCEADPQGDYCRQCEPGTSECSSDGSESLSTCNQRGYWGAYDACDSGSTCEDSGTADYCTTCSPGARMCTGAGSYRECPSNGIQTNNQINCPDNLPVCLGATGQCVACSPTDTPRCPGGAGSQAIEVCSSQGVWEQSTCGGTTQVCLGGSCVACNPGNAECTGPLRGDRRACQVTGAWLTQNCTATGLDVCLGGNCVACKPGVGGDAPRCPGGSAAAREVCGGDGQWAAQNCSGNTPVCVQGACQQCNSGNTPAQCVPSSGASGRQTCTSGSWTTANCSGDTPVCTGSGQCVCQNGALRCDSSGVRQTCQNQVWVNTPCASNLSCAGSGVCQQCLSDDDCEARSPQLPFCNGSGACVCNNGDEHCTGGGAHEVCVAGAWQSQPCSGSTPVCDTTTGQSTSGQCVCQNTREQCANGVLQTCTNKAWVNNPGSPSCTACTTSLTCEGTPNTPLCNGVYCEGCSGSNCPMNLACAGSGACVQCTTANLSNCGSNVPACSSNNTCVECTAASHALCTGTEPVCGSNNQCRGCQSNSECPSNKVCGSTGACVDCTSADSSKCPSGTPACSANNTCVICSATNSTACSGSSVCDVTSNTCVQCTSNAQCTSPTMPQCDTAQHLCSGCQSNAACQGMTVCGPSGTCVNCTAADTSKCPVGAPACNASNQCVECTSTDSSACLNGDVCDANASQCVECVTEFDCPMNEPVCNPDVNQCVGCLVAGDCASSAAGDVCDMASLTCVECNSADATACTGTTPVCGTNKQCRACSTNGECPGSSVCGSGGACVECNQDADCSGAEGVCSGNHCVECTASDASACGGTTPVCGSNNTCVACTVDAECSGTAMCVLSGSNQGACVAVQCTSNANCGSGTPVCSNNSCVQCTPSQAQACTGNTDVCGPSNTCVACNSDPDCSGGDVCSNHVCVDCVNSGDCSAPLAVCSNSLCVECTPAMASACTGTTPVCGSNNDCTACTLDNQCSGGQVCGMSGACVDCDTAMDCGSGATPACDALTNQCVACTDSDPGACTGSTPVCLSQACVACTDTDLGACMPGQVCGPSNTCVECNDEMDCDVMELCNAAHQCFLPECMSDTECADPTPICDLANFVCVP